MSSRPLATGESRLIYTASDVSIEEPRERGRDSTANSGLSLSLYYPAVVYLIRFHSRGDGDANPGSTYYMMVGGGVVEVWLYDQRWFFIHFFRFAAIFGFVPLKFLAAILCQDLKSLSPSCRSRVAEANLTPLERDKNLLH